MKPGTAVAFLVAAVIFVTSGALVWQCSSALAADIGWWNALVACG